MADAKNSPFDPYHKWLGIPKDQRPPTFYQLLGLSPNESDSEVIQEAAIRQSAHLRAYQMGPQGELCKRLLNEIGRAQQTLLNPQKKKEYDARLGQQSAPKMTKAIAAKPIIGNKSGRADSATSFSAEAKSARRAANERERRIREAPSIKKPNAPLSTALLVGSVAGGVFALVLIAVVAVWFLRRQAAVQDQLIVAIAAERNAAVAKLGAIAPPANRVDEPVAPKPAIVREADKPALVPNVANPNRFGPAAKFFGTWMASPEGSGLTRQLYLYQDADSKWQIHFTYHNDTQVLGSGIGTDAIFENNRIEYTLVHDRQKTPELPERIVSHLEFRGNSLFEVLHFTDKFRSREYVRVNLPDSLRQRLGSWRSTLIDGTRLEITFERLSESDSRGKFVLALPKEEPITVPMSAIRPYGSDLAFEISLDRLASPRWKAITRGVLVLKEGSALGRFEGAGSPTLEMAFSRDANAPPVVGVAHYSKNDPKFAAPFDAKINPKSPPDPVAAKEPPGDKAAIEMMPSAEQIATATKLIQEQFAKEFVAAKKSSVDRGALAAKLIKLAQDTTDDPPARYVLFVEGRDLGCQAGQCALALEAIDALSREFGLDSLEQRDAAIALLLKNSNAKTSLDDTAGAAIALVYDGIAADRVDVAQRALAATKNAASRSANAALLGQVKKIEPDLKRLSQDFERMKKAEKALAANADDAAAHLDLGRYLALHKADWDRGLPHLAKGPASELSAAAKKDIDNPQEPKMQHEVGDLWWALAEKETGAVRAVLQRRAGYWYRQMTDQATGFTRSLLADRLKAIELAPAPLKTSAAANVLVEAKRFKGHTAGVTGLQVFTDDKTFSSGSLDGTIRVWDLGSGKQVTQIDTTMPVLSYAFSPSDRFLAAVAKDRMRVYDWSTRTLVVGPTAVIKPGAFWSGDDTLFSTLADGAYEHRDFFRKEMSEGPRFPVPGAALAGSFGAPYSVSLGKDVCFFRAVFGPAIATMRKKLDIAEATCAAFSRGNRWMVVGGADKRLRVFNTDTVEVTTVFESPTIPKAIAVSRDGRRVLSGGDDKIVRLWDVTTGKEVARSPVLPSAVQAVAFTNDDVHALSGGGDPILCLWNLPRDKK